MTISIASKIPRVSYHTWADAVKQWRSDRFKSFLFDQKIE